MGIKFKLLSLGDSVFVSGLSSERGRSINGRIGTITGIGSERAGVQIDGNRFNIKFDHLKKSINQRSSDGDMLKAHLSEEMAKRNIHEFSEDTLEFMGLRFELADLSGCYVHFSPYPSLFDTETSFNQHKNRLLLKALTVEGEGGWNFRKIASNYSDWLSNSYQIYNQFQYTPEFTPGMKMKNDLQAVRPVARQLFNQILAHCQEDWFDWDRLKMLTERAGAMAKQHMTKTSVTSSLMDPDPFNKPHSDYLDLYIGCVFNTRTLDTIFTEFQNNHFFEYKSLPLYDALVSIYERS